MSGGHPWGPARPAIRLPGPHRTLRYEFMPFDHEKPEEALDESRIRAWMRARVRGDEHLRIVREVVHAFHARMAERRKAGRMLVAGAEADLRAWRFGDNQSRQSRLESVG